MELRKARVTPDSIIAAPGDTGYFAISRDSVARVEQRHFQAGPTALVVLSALAGLALVVIIGLSTDDTDPFGPTAGR